MVIRHVLGHVFRHSWLVGKARESTGLGSRKQATPRRGIEGLRWRCRLLHSPHSPDHILCCPLFLCCLCFCNTFFSSFPTHPPHTHQNVRMWFIMGGIIAAVVFLIVLAACGWNFKHC